MLTEIKDPLRLKRGDLMVIPSEAGTGGKKKLHLSPSSYRGWGLSTGFTGRSDNTEEGIRSLLSSDNGKPTVLYAYDTSVRVCYTDREERYGDLLGGMRHKVKPDGPEIKKAFFMRLPLPGDCDLVCARYWVSYFGECVANELYGSLTFGHMYEKYPPCRDKCNDQAVKDAVDSLASVERTESRESFWSLVPVGSVGQRADTKMTVDEIKDKFLGSGVFENSFGVSQKDHSIVAGPPFLRKMAKYGVKFYRPDAEFLGAVSRQVAATIMSDYADRQRHVLQRAKKFVERLKGDLEGVKRRGTSACAITKKLQLRKPEVRRLFKSLV